MADIQLPIRRLTLYKHGVGFVEREGRLESDQPQNEIQLVFRQSEVNDALKSLLVLDRQGGQVRGIHYETPGGNFPDDNRLALSPDHSLLDLLKSLRGRQVRLSIGEGTSQRELTGRLLGVEVDEDRPLTRSLVALLEGDGSANQIVTLALKDLQSVNLLEERSGQDLRFLLDSSRSDEAHRTVSLQLDSGQAGHDLLVSYLVPCPTWRVSYRLVAETETKPAAEPTPTEGAPQPTADLEDRRGELILQGWGLFDNRLEEDLENVEVRLVAGQPISFIYDLTTSRIPVRPVVQDTARVASGPVQFDEALNFAAADSGFGLSDFDAYEMAEKAYPAPPPMMAAAPAGGPRPMSRKAMMRESAPAQPAAKGNDLGELFQYQVTNPVTVKRGESALVPILNNTLPYRHELLYNGQKMPQHPVATLRFKNETGLVLERGPITVIEDNEYRGEALISFTPANGEVYLAYAVELGLKVTEQQQSSSDTYGIQVRDRLLYFNNIITLKTTYEIENSLEQNRVVTIEQPTRSGYDLAPTMRPPAEQTAEFYRWKVPCQARRRTTFVVEERMLNWRTEEIIYQNYNTLVEYFNRNWLDAETLRRLKPILDEQTALRQGEEESNNLQVERGDLYRRQEQLRQNMAALATTGEEAQLRRRVFEQLARSEERLAAIDQRLEQLKAESKQHQANINQLLEEFK